MASCCISNNEQLLYFFTSSLFTFSSYSSSPKFLSFSYFHSSLTRFFFPKFCFPISLSTDLLKSSSPARNRYCSAFYFFLLL